MSKIVLITRFHCVAAWIGIVCLHRHVNVMRLCLIGEGTGDLTRGSHGYGADGRRVAGPLARVDVDIFIGVAFPLVSFGGKSFGVPLGDSDSEVPVRSQFEWRGDAEGPEDGLPVW
jgi:hypothetical protein